MKILYPLMLTVCLLAINRAAAAVFTVTTLNDSGAGSLRQAMLDANASTGADTLNFNLPSGGVQTIAPLTPLPDITGPVSINGYSQPGSSANTLAGGNDAVLLIRLDGVKLTSGFPVALNFKAGAGGSSVRGMVIVRFASAVYANELSNFTVAGNWVGMDVDGVARGTSFEAIYITSFFSPANNVIIGGTAPADRNVISGNRYGVWFNGATTANSAVLGNFIGTDPTGTLPRGNLFGGVNVFGATNITIGGTLPGARNVIAGATAAGGTGVTVQGGGGAAILNNLIGTDVSGRYDLGNSSDGVYITSSQSNRIIGNEIVNNRANGINLASSSGTVVENNYIGTDSSLTRPLGNALAGITLSGSTNRIGGAVAGQANTIQFNGGAGVAVTASTAVQNEISANRIFDNGGLGIDLGPSGVTTNDVLDADTGANGLQNFPVLTNATVAFSSLTVQGQFNSKPGGTYRLDFFASPDWDAANLAEGQLYLGATTVATDGGGNANFSTAFSSPPPTNSLITATATDASGNTSEFSASLALAFSGAVNPTLVIAAGSAGTTTLSWPGAAAFFGLEKTVSLSLPVQWQPVTGGIADSGGVKSFVITNSLGGSQQFFRLKKP